jgi:hypothetical protein
MAADTNNNNCNDGCTAREHENKVTKVKSRKLSKFQVQVQADRISSVSVKATVIKDTSHFLFQIMVCLTQLQNLHL